MMKKVRLKQKIWFCFGFLILSLLVYSCLQDEEAVDKSKVISGKNHELTIAAARSWYESKNLPIATTRSVVTHFELMTKPRWNKARESRAGYFEVVEIPLMTRASAILLDHETKDKYDPEVDRKKIHNVIRMVIIKNLNTGEIIHFMMVFVGTYDYLMTTKTFHKNSYLHRELDFSGSVYFYQIGGGFVNGWKYKNGNIVAKIRQGTEEGLHLPVTRGQTCSFEPVWVEYDDCHGVGYEDPEYGAGGGVECTTYERLEYTEVCEDDGSDDDDNDNDNNNNNNGGGSWLPGGIGGGGYVPPTNPNNNPPNPTSDANKLVEKLCGASSNLTSSQKEVLGASFAILQLCKPAVYEMIKSLANSGVSFTFLIVDPTTLNSSAKYSTKGEIKIAGEAGIGDYISLGEEMVHAAQHNMFYKNDMLKDLYTKNIELEAKVLCEGTQTIHDNNFDARGSNILIGASELLKGAVENLMNSIKDAGGFTDSQLELYREVGRHVENEWNSKYKDSTFDPNFLPKALYEYLKPKK